MIQIKTLAVYCQALDTDMKSQVGILSKFFSSRSLLLANQKHFNFLTIFPAKDFKAYIV